MTVIGVVAMVVGVVMMVIGGADVHTGISS